MQYASALVLALAASASAVYLDVTTWSAQHCVGTSQGTTSIGTSGKCVNMSNAGSISFGLSENGGGCKSGVVTYYRNTGCTKEYDSGTWSAATCMNLGSGYVHGSAHYKCTA